MLHMCHFQCSLQTRLQSIACCIAVHTDLFNIHDASGVVTLRGYARRYTLLAVDADAVIGCVQALLELSSMIAPKVKVELRLKNFALQVCSSI